MSRIKETFDRLRRLKEKAFIPFITCGDPNIDKTYEILFEFQKRGVDIVELGVPFSDPLADGKTIQKASMRALSAGTTLGDVLGLVQRLRRDGFALPIVLMGCYNPIVQYGEERFCEDAQDAGVDGVLVSDLPPEEGEEFEQRAKKKGLDVIYLVAPTTPPHRVKYILEHASGYIYYISILGVTGAREKLAEDLADKVRRIKEMTQLPVAVGFGVSKPEHARQVAQVSDGVVVGSAIIDIMERSFGSPDMIKCVGEFVEELVRATKGWEEGRQ